MNNIFMVGQEVKSESQIGYTRYIEKITDILLNTSCNISISGQKGFGKTSIVKEVLRQIRNKSSIPILTVFINLSKQKSFVDFLSSIIDYLNHELTETRLQEFLNDEEYNLLVKEINFLKPKIKECKINIVYRNTEQIFHLIKEKGYRIILAIDEFDAARFIFKNAAEYEFLRCLSMSYDADFSLILISRCPYYEIERNFIHYDDDSFYDFVITYSVKGFDEEDFTVLYRILKEKYDIELNDTAKGKLRYYCDCSPYLVSMFAHDIVDKHLKNQPYDIDEIFQQRAIDIENYNKSISVTQKNEN